MKLAAVRISSGTEIFDHLAQASVSEGEVSVIAVDEAFMIDDIADVLITLFRKGLTIVVSSIDMSASCIPFDEIVKMLPWATHVEKCSAVCLKCLEDAHYTQRKHDAGVGEIQVGGADMYEPRCWKCHTQVSQITE
jgi:thymidine kinase